MLLAAGMRLRREVGANSAPVGDEATMNWGNCAIGGGEPPPGARGQGSPCARCFSRPRRRRSSAPASRGRKRSAARWSRPISTIPTSTPSALRFGSPTKPFRRLTPAISRPSSARQLRAGGVHANSLNPLSGQTTPSFNYNSHPRSYGVQANETIFNGNKTINSDPPGRIAGVRVARTAAQHRAEYPSFGRHRLHGRAAGHRHSRSRPQQRRRSAGAAARDPRPFHRRRSHPHRRRAGGGEPCRARRRPL